MSDFYEDDEPVEKIKAAFESGEKGVIEHACDPRNSDPANRQPAEGARVVRRRRLPPGVTATAHTYTTACAGHHSLSEPCPGA